MPYCRFTHSYDDDYIKYTFLKPTVSYRQPCPGVTPCWTGLVIHICHAWKHRMGIDRDISFPWVFAKNCCISQCKSKSRSWSNILHPLKSSTCLVEIRLSKYDKISHVRDMYFLLRYNVTKSFELVAGTGQYSETHIFKVQPVSKVCRSESNRKVNGWNMRALSLNEYKWWEAHTTRKCRIIFELSLWLWLQELSTCFWICMRLQEWTKYFPGAENAIWMCSHASCNWHSAGRKCQSSDP
jgi:hypothetical protein